MTALIGRATIKLQDRVAPEKKAPTFLPVYIKWGLSGEVIKMTVKEIIRIPRGWAPGDYSFSVTDGKLYSHYEPEGNVHSLTKESIVWEESLKRMETEEVRETVRDRHTHLARQAREGLDEALEEDERRIQNCLSRGLDKREFRRLFYLYKNPNADKIESVYVIKQNNSNYFKIGVSNIPERRLPEMNTANPHGAELIMYYTGTSPYEREKMLHNHFADERVREDAEWFKLERIDLVSIEKTFEHWLKEDMEVLQYLGLNSNAVGINKGPFKKWNPSWL